LSCEASAAVRPVNAGDVPVVNFDTSEHLRQRGSSVAFVEKLIRVFIADNSTLLVKVEQTLAARSYHELRSLLHAMKGSSASMGTDRLSRLRTNYDKLSDAELRLQAPSLLRTLTEELAIVREQLERYVQERQSSAV
jgi:HPt (histidine-containing phosphotransfer) domain-containing protein